MSILKREYMIIPIRAYFTFTPKQPYLSLYWQKYQKKFLIKKRIQKEKYETKGENKKIKISNMKI